MKALFNGHCDGCRRFTPRCAVAYLRVPGKASAYAISRRLTLCDRCRASDDYRGRFTVDAQHK